MGLTPTVTYCIWHDHQGVRGHIFSTLKKKNSCGGGRERPLGKSELMYEI